MNREAEPDGKPSRDLRGANAQRPSRQVAGQVTSTKPALWAVAVLLLIEAGLVYAIILFNENYLSDEWLGVVYASGALEGAIVVAGLVGAVLGLFRSFLVWIPALAGGWVSFYLFLHEHYAVCLALSRAAQDSRDCSVKGTSGLLTAAAVAVLGLLFGIYARWGFRRDMALAHRKAVENATVEKLVVHIDTVLNGVPISSQGWLLENWGKLTIKSKEDFVAARLPIIRSELVTVSTPMDMLGAVQRWWEADPSRL